MSDRGRFLGGRMPDPSFLVVASVGKSDGWVAAKAWIRAWRLASALAWP